MAAKFGKSFVLSLCTVLLCTAVASIATAGVTISPAHPELLQQGILDAYHAGQKSVVIPAGTYLVPAVNGHHLDFENMSNFEIDARGATFVFQDVTTNGILFYNCVSVYFHGATVYYGTPPFSQGVVQAAAADGSSLDIQIEQGYPTNLDDAKYFSANLAGHIFDSTTRLWKRNVWGDFYGTSTQRLGADTFRIFTPTLAGAVGDLVGIRPGTGDHIIKVISCSLMNLSDLTILNSPLFGIVELYGASLGANTYTNITITRGSRPAGAITDPLFSTSADGFHSANAKTGPYVTGCSFAYMADDGIAVHGFFSWVMESSGNTLIVSDTAPYGSNFHAGDTLQLFDTNNDPADTAIVISVTPLPAYTNGMKSARSTVRDFTVGPYSQLTLDRSVTAGFDYLAGDPNASGAGFVALNNTISNNRGRGIIVKADTGTIQGNTIDGSMLGGIKVGPDFQWGEAGEVSKMVITGNTINNVAFSADGFAGVLIGSDPVPALPGVIIRNVTIDGNTFSNFDVAAIFVSSASGVTITNNVFTNLQNAVPFIPDYLGQNVLSGALVFVTQSNGVQFHGNAVSHPGAVNAFFAEALPGSGVSGAAYVTPIASSDADFSGTQGALNWNYGYFPSGDVNAFALLPFYDSANALWRHTTYGPPWTGLWSYSGFHPNGAESGIEEWATRRWTSTFTGAATIAGHLAKTDTSPNSPGVFGRVYVNHSLVYEHFLPGTDGTGVDYSVNVPLRTGDTVDFAIAPNGVEYNDATRFTSSILSTTLVNQTIAFGALPTQIVGSPPFTLNASASSGLGVAFVSNSTGVCTVSGTTVTLVAAGTCSITASQPGDSVTYGPAAPVTVTFTVDSSFGDVSSANESAAFITAIDDMLSKGITSGCQASPREYCPSQDVTRGQMAVFIISSIYRSINFTYNPTPYFTDATPASVGGFFPFIQKMRELGITSGCTPTTYCPNDNVTRGQMAVFIILARYGNLAFDFPATPYFSDATTASVGGFFKYIQRMRRDNITGGCTPTTYCPNDNVTRDQMAVFLMVGGFNLAAPTTPVLSSVSPATGGLGDTINVTLTAVNTHFAQGTTTVTAGAGITVGTVTVNSATSLTAQLTIASNAKTTPVSLLVTTPVTTGTEEVVLPNGFTITTNPAAGVIAYWNGNGTTANSISSMSGTLINGATYASATSRTLGLPDAQAFSLDGTNSYVQAAAGETGTVSGARTLAAWVYPNASSGLGMPILTGSDIFGITGTTGTCSSSGQYQLYIDDGGTCYVSNISLAPGVWSFVAVTFDGSRVVFYIDGVASVTVPAALMSNYGIATLEIGGNTLGGSSSGASFDGLLSEAQVYNRALSPVEIQGLYAP